MRRNASFLVIVFCIVLILVTLRASAQGAPNSCRIDISMSDPAVFDQQFSGFVDDMMTKGYSTVSVYGFAVEGEDGAIALARAQAAADYIATRSGGKIVAVPQLGVADGVTGMFSPSEGKRVIISTSQLFQEEYLPPRGLGNYDPGSCPIILYCEKTKQYRGDWYCMKVEGDDEVWYGPCANEGCVGDTEFTLVSGRRKTELKNSLGEDAASLNSDVADLVSRADILSESGFALKASQKYQEALEISLKIDPEQRKMDIESIRRSRDDAFSAAVSTAVSEKDAGAILSLKRRSERLTPDWPLAIESGKMVILEETKDKTSSAAYYTIVVLLTVLSIIVVVSLIHLLVRTAHSRKAGRNKVLDEAAEEIISDIEGLEESFRKKSMLIEDDIAKLKELR